MAIEPGTNMVSIKTPEGIELWASRETALAQNWRDGATINIFPAVQAVADLIHSNDLDDELDAIDDAKYRLLKARETYYKVLKDGISVSGGEALVNAQKAVDRAQEDLDRAQSRCIAIEMRNMRISAATNAGDALIGGSGGAAQLMGGQGMNPVVAAAAGGFVGYWLGNETREDRDRRRGRRGDRGYSTVPR